MGPDNRGSAHRAPVRLSRWQYSLGGLLQSMMLLSVLAAIYGGIIRGVARKDPFATVVFVGLSLTVPVGLMMAFSAWQNLRVWWRSPRQQPTYRPPVGAASADEARGRS